MVRIGRAHTFSPDNSFSFATTYTASVTPALKSIVPEAALIEPFAFETPQLSIKSLETQWVEESSGLRWLRCRVELNQSLLPDELIPALGFSLDGKPLTGELEDHFPTTSFYIRFNGVGQTEKGKNLEAQINPSKLPKSLKSWLREPVKSSIQLASKKELVAYGLEVDYGSSGTTIQVRLSQNIGIEELKKFVEVPGFDGLTMESYRYGIRISGEFPSQATLELILKKGLKGAAGGTLKEDKTIGFRIGVSDSYIRFANSKSTYLPREGERFVGVYTESVPELLISIYQVFPNAVLSHFQGGGNYYNEEEYYSDYEEETGSLLSSQTLKTKQLKREGDQYMVPLPKTGFQGQKGLFVVKIADAEHRYIGAKKVVVVTDIGLMAKSNSNEIWVQATSLQTNKPVGSATVGIVGKNNQVLFQAQTDGQGQVLIPKNKLMALGSPPAMITCENGTDFSYLLLTQSQIETSRFPVDGIPVSQSGWQAEVFGPRNLYLPGETIDLNVLVRDRNLVALGDVPVLAKVLSPMGKMVHLIKTTTGKLGQGNFNFTLPSYLSTGTYSVDIIAGEREILATHYIHLESFDPIPLDISTGTIPNFLTRGKDWEVKLAVENMFGIPASQRPVEAQITWRNADFNPTGFEKFNFYLFDKEENSQILQGFSQTDDLGKANLNLPTSQIPANEGLVEVKARIQVFDDAQIPVYKTLRTQLLTQPSLIGFLVPGDKFQLRKLNKIQLVSLNTDGKLVPGSAWVDIFQISYNQVMESAPDEPSGFRYVSRRVKKQLVHQKVDLQSGRGEFPYFPKTYGDFEMEIRVGEQSERYLNFSAYVYEGDNQGTNGEDLNQEGNIEIGFPSKSWEPGESALIHFSTPFDGKLTVCVEQDRILKTIQLDAKNKSAQFVLPIQAEMAPNVYISALLTREMADSKNQNPLTTAHGYASLPVLRTDRKLKTEISVPAKWTSGKKLPIEIELEPGKNQGLALAVVDDGILQVTQYRIPDPFVWFHRKQALQTQTYSMFGKIIQASLGGKGQPGGDGLYMKMAGDELDTKQLLSAFLTSESPKQDGLGELQEVAGSRGTRYKAWVNIPAGFAGRVRIVAISYSQKKVGFAEKTLTIADPITIKTSLPDFLVPGNRFEGNATFFNTSNQSQVFQPTVTVSKSVAIQANWPQNLALKPGELKRLSFFILPKEESLATVTFEAKSGEKTISSKGKSFPIKVPAGIVRQQLAGEISPGQQVSFNRSEFLTAQKLKATVEVGFEPWLSLSPGIQSLISYPYGCLEQTVSAAFPLLYLPDSWVEKLAKNQPTDQPNDKWRKRVFVTDAIQKIASLQQPGGGFSYWPGGDVTYPYYSVYATHFLWEARQAGFSVQPEVLKNALEYVDEISKENNFWWYSGLTKGPVTRLASRTPYALFVSSLAGKPNRQALMQWKAQPEKLDQEGKFMLAGAFLFAGDGASFEKIIPKDWQSTLTPVKPEKIDSYSPIYEPEVLKTSTQEEAFVLGVLSQCWPTHPMAKKLALKLRSKIANHSEQMSTQELGMAATALARHMKPGTKENPALQVNLGTKRLLNNKEGKVSFSSWNEPLVLKNESKKQGLFYWIQEEGISSGGKLPEEDHGLIVRKTYYDVHGKPINPANLQLNSLVLVRLSLVSASGLPVERIALVDIIPACLRIENKRIDQSSDFKTPTQPSEPDYFDIRRDRMNIFCSAEKKEKSYYFAARVVALGEYTWGPAEAQAMYHPGMFSRHGSVSIRVSEIKNEESRTQ